MKIPYDILRLYKRDGEDFGKKLSIDDVYVTYKCLIDANEISIIEEGYLQGVTNLYMKSGERILMRGYYETTRLIIMQMKINFYQRELLIFKQ